MDYTPFGYYDNDPDFQCDAENVAKWASYRLGFPVTDIELQSVNFFAAFEEAVNEYGAQINTFNARDHLLNLQGQSTGSSVNLSGKYIPNTLRGIIRLAKNYGSEVGAGGTQTYYTGSIQLTANKQIYDFTTDATLETGSFANDTVTIRKIFHEGPPAVNRFLDPALGTGIGQQTFLSQFGWGGMVIPGNYLLMPMYHDMLRVQAVEFNDQMRKSGYSFQLTGNRLRIFPIPWDNVKLFFHYSLDNDGLPMNSNDSLADATGRITDLSNIPYQNLTYRYINQIGRQWIRKYTLALVKEMLGYVRSKYGDFGTPDAPLTLNGADLISAGQAEKEALITELKESLDQMSFQSQLERKVAIADNLNKQLAYIPMKIYFR